MIDNFDDWRTGRKSKRFRNRIRKGVPDCVRGKVWQMMMGSMVSGYKIVHCFESNRAGFSLLPMLRSRIDGVQCGAVRLESVRFGSARFGSIWFVSVRCGPDRIGSVRIRPIRFDSVRFSLIKARVHRFLASLVGVRRTWLRVHRVLACRAPIDAPSTSAPSFY